MTTPAFETGAAEAFFETVDSIIQFPFSVLSQGNNIYMGGGMIIMTIGLAITYRLFTVWLLGEYITPNGHAMLRFGNNRFVDLDPYRFEGKSYTADTVPLAFYDQKEYKRVKAIEATGRSADPMTVKI